MLNIFFYKARTTLWVLSLNNDKKLGKIDESDYVKKSDLANNILDDCVGVIVFLLFFSCCGIKCWVKPEVARDFDKIPALFRLLFRFYREACWIIDRAFTRDRDLAFDITAQFISFRPSSTKPGIFCQRRVRINSRDSTWIPGLVWCSRFSGMYGARLVFSGLELRPLVKDREDFRSSIQFHFRHDWGRHVPLYKLSSIWNSSRFFAEQENSHLYDVTRKILFSFKSLLFFVSFIDCRLSPLLIMRVGESFMVWSVSIRKCIRRKINIRACALESPICPFKTPQGWLTVAKKLLVFPLYIILLIFFSPLFLRVPLTTRPIWTFDHSSWRLRLKVHVLRMPHSLVCVHRLQHFFRTRVQRQIYTDTSTDT